MSSFDRVLELLITVVLIIGGYQFYFWAQRQSYYAARYFETRFDAWVRFDPRWVWLYSGLYYPMIVFAAWAQPTWEDYARTVGGFLLLLMVQVTIFVLWPVAIPLEWRTNLAVHRARQIYPRSMRFLDMVWSIDKLRNSLPSMHVSVAMMVDLTISSTWPWFGLVGWLFPVLIAISALKTKQHYVVDVVPGALTGAIVFYVWKVLTVA